MSQELHQFVKDLFAGEGDYFTTDEDGILNVKIPPRYAELPELPEIEGHTKVTVDGMKQYFESIKTDDGRIQYVNGMYTMGDPFGCLYCDYCRTSIHDQPGSTYRYCWDCHLDMCDLCFAETDEATAVANGAKNYAQRKDKLEACRQHRLTVRDRPAPTGFCCDDCGDTIEDPERYSNYNEVGGTDCQDLCLKCAQTDKGRELIENEKLTIHDNKPKSPIDQCEFGSFLDWVPVLEDEEGDAVYVNLNPQSPYYQQVCLQSMDDHGRSGYGTLGPDVTLDQALERIKHYQNQDDWKELDGWDKVYNFPIKQYMHEKKMQIHFG